MEPFEIVMTIINTLAVISIPVVSVMVGHHLQNRAEKRKDKMNIFQCLMTHRATGWANPVAVDALNTIDIVFADSEAVCQQWHKLFDKYRPEIPYQEQYKEQCKLLELMAIDLGYKDKITWDTIQSPYYPVGLSQQAEQNTEIMKGQLAWAKAAEQFANSIQPNIIPTVATSTEKENTNGSN